MITVTIAGMTVDGAKAGEGWISQMVVEARKRGAALCVRVDIQEPSAHIVLSTPGCGVSGGGSRPPNEVERRLFDAWNRRGLGTGQFSPGDLRAFLNEAARLT